MNASLEQIDFFAAEYHRTKDVKCFEQFLKLLSPFIHRTINKACVNSTWDKQDLYAIISADMWRLLNHQAPIEGMHYHWLCLRQIKNKLINCITTTMREKSFKICPLCSKTYTHLVYICEECCAPLTATLRETYDTLDSTETYENMHHYVPNYLEDIVQQEFVENLLAKVTDPITKKIVQMTIDGASYTEIATEVGIARNAIKRRLRKCGLIVHQLIKESV